MTREREQTRKAYAALTEARKKIIEGAAELTAISERKGTGVCMCGAIGEGAPGQCAYHSGLTMSCSLIVMRLEEVLAELRIDIVDPDRKH